MNKIIKFSDQSRHVPNNNFKNSIFQSILGKLSHKFHYDGNISQSKETPGTFSFLFQFICLSTVSLKSKFFCNKISFPKSILLVKHFWKIVETFSIFQRLSHIKNHKRDKSFPLVKQKFQFVLYPNLTTICKTAGISKTFDFHI